VLGEVRAAVARSHLARNEISISEIAHLLGFTELSSFSRAFRQWTGQSPVRYRAAHAPGMARSAR
jgi:AraC-like DNA-binding protein